MNNKKYLILLIRFMYALIYLGPLKNIFIKKQIFISNKNKFPYNDFSDFKFKKSIIIVNKIKKEGYCIAGTINDDFMINNLKDFCFKQTIVNPHLTNPIVKKIVYSNQIYQVLKLYFGTEPILYNTLLYKRQDNVNLKAENCKRDFHFDVGDYKVITVFLYLTDVNMHASPHVVIKNTHMIPWYKKIVKRFLTVEEAEKNYSKDIIYMCENAGTLIFEDLSCYHKRAYGNQERIILSATYHIRRRQSKVFTKIKKIIMALD